MLAIHLYFYRGGTPVQQASRVSLITNGGEGSSKKNEILLMVGNLRN